MIGFQKKEQELFLKIENDIKKYPNRYRNAGKWLDKYFDDTVFLSKKQKEIEQQKHQLRIEIKRLESEIKSDISTFGDSTFGGDRRRLEGKLFTRNQRLEFIRQFETKCEPCLKERLAYALEDLFVDYKQAGTLSQDDATAVLLIIWLATCAEANDLNLDLTKFANVPWKTKDSTSEPMRHGLATFLFSKLDIALHYEYAYAPKPDDVATGPVYELDLNYLRLVHGAWRKVEANKKIEKKATPNDKPIIRDSAKQLWDLEGIISRLIKARIKEEEDYNQNCVGKSEPRKITSEFLENIKEELFSEEIKAFLNRQEKELKKIIEYIAGVQKFAEKHQKLSGTINLLEELIDWESSSCEFELDNEDADKTKIVGLIITGHVKYYIEKKRDVLSKLHALIIKNNYGFLTEEMTPKTNYNFSSTEKSKLQLLMRQFEDGASKYPALSHMVMSWPFMHLMPRPPKDKFPDFEFPRLREKSPYLSLFFPPPLLTSETLTKTWFIDKHEAGLNRFSTLATEAGEIVAKVLFDYKGPLHFYHETYGRWWIGDLFYTATNLWLQAIHLLRKTLVWNDGWDGLFDEDSDFSDKGFGKGLYNFWESKDVFLDSTLLCNMLLNNAEIHETPAETGKKIQSDKKPKAEAWEQITIEVVDDDTIKYKVNDKNWKRANYTEFGFLDKRKNQPNILWPIFLGLASKNLPSNINRPKMKSKDIDRIRDTLRKFFGIKYLPIRYNRRAKEYRCNFTFNDPRDWTGTLKNENLAD